MKIKEQFAPRRLARHIILAAIVVVLALIGWTVYLMLMIKPATDVANKFLDNLRAKNPDAALILTTEDFKKNYSKSGLEQALNTPSAAEVLKQDYDLHTRKVIKKSPLTINLVYSFEYNRNDYEISMTLIKQNNEFKIDKASIDSSALKQQFFRQ